MKLKTVGEGFKLTVMVKAIILPAKSLTYQFTFPRGELSDSSSHSPSIHPSTHPPEFRSWTRPFACTCEEQHRSWFQAVYSSVWHTDNKTNYSKGGSIWPLWFFPHSLSSHPCQLWACPPSEKFFFQRPTPLVARSCIFNSLLMSSFSHLPLNTHTLNCPCLHAGRPCLPSHLTHYVSG